MIQELVKGGEIEALRDLIDSKSVNSEDIYIKITNRNNVASHQQRYNRFFYYQ